MCLLLAALSLLLPAAPGADPWAWIIWGREVGELSLDTTAGPSWKPLPVIFTAPFSIFGDAAPELWLVVARAGGLAALVFAFMLARRLAGTTRPGLGVLAGSVAVGGIVLLPEWVTFMAQGTSEPLAVGLILLAVLRHLDGRPGHALVLGFVVALARPEAWPFLAVYGAFVFHRHPGLRPLAGGLALAVPLLWFVPDWIGAGDPLYGARRARAHSEGVQLGGETTSRALRQALETFLVPVLAAAVAGVVFAWRRRERATLVLAAVSFPWVLLVVGMAVAGYRGNSRYMVPAAAVICVLAGVGAARLLDGVQVPRLRYALAAALVAVSVPFGVPRASEMGDQADRVRLEDRLVDDLPEAVREAGGRAAILRCGRPAANGFPRRPGMDRAVAWQLHVPLHRVPLLRGTGRRSLRGASGSIVLFAPPNGSPSASAGGRAVRRLARTVHWDVAAVNPPESCASRAGQAALARSRR